MSKIVSAFTGTGKSYFATHSPRRDVVDLDSGMFNRSNSKFPHNYINHIKDNIDKKDIVLISTHESVRNILVSEQISFTLVYPRIDLKGEYIKRLERRGDDNEFINRIEYNWDRWITQLWEQQGCEHTVLKSGEYLSNYI